MKRLGAMQVKERDKHAQDVRNTTSELNAEIDKFNKAVEEAKAGLEAAITKHNEKLQEVRDWRDGIVGDMESYVGERSEKWSESDAASEYQDWKGEFENLELEDVEIELPEELELIDNDDRADGVDNLPEAPG